MSAERRIRLFEAGNVPMDNSETELGAHERGVLAHSLYWSEVEPALPLFDLKTVHDSNLIS